MPRILLRGKDGRLEIFAQLALGLRNPALRFLVCLPLLGALRDFVECFLRLFFKARQRLFGAAFQLFELGRFLLFPFARELFFALLQRCQLLAHALLQRLRLFNAPVQLSQETRYIPLAVAHGLACAAHDVFGYPKPRRNLQSRGLSR